MLGGCFTEALALEREPVSVVHQAIENGIGKSRITDDLVPMFDQTRRSLKVVIALASICRRYFVF